MMCAGDKNMNTCNGDSGGGGIYHGLEDRRPVLMGVVFFGNRECGIATIFTKVMPYVAWIIQETQLTDSIAWDLQTTKKTTTTINLDAFEFWGLQMSFFI